MITLAIDFASAESYLALDPTIKLTDELNLELEILPFPVKHDRPARTSNEESKGERHLRIRAEYRQMDVQRYAKARGIELLATAHGIDASIAHNGLLIANEQGVGVEYSRHVFSKFWSGLLDLADQGAILEILEYMGVHSDSGVLREPQAVRKCREELAERGVFSVPTYIVDDELYIGREHLPLIHWTLTGRKDPVPL